MPCSQHTVMRGHQMKLAIKRFMEKVKIEQNGCWRWTGYICPNGYSQFSEHNRHFYAHRWGVEHFRHTTIPKGMQCDHICRNKWCVNPNHIDIVTQSVNAQRGRSAFRERAHCKRGHALVKANIVKATGGDGHEYKSCKKCRVLLARRDYIRRTSGRGKP